MNIMQFDDRPDFAKRLEKARVLRGFKTAKAAADFYGWNYHTYAHHEQGIRGIGRAATKYAIAFRVSEAWLLTGEGEAPPTPRVPVMGIAAGAATGQNIMHDTPLDYVSRPPALENVPSAYAVWVRGESMLPRFRPGDLLFVHPWKQPLPGDAVIVQQRVNGDPAAFVKEMVTRGDGAIICRQYNPPATIDYPLRTLLAVHKVLSLQELFG